MLQTDSIAPEKRPRAIDIIERNAADDDVEVAVIDTGEGITADFLPYVFEPFRQAEAKLARGDGGLGLGLAISRQLVELHGGTGSDHVSGKRLSHAPREADRPTRTGRRRRDACATTAGHVALSRSS
jgi:hypothetical protein